MNEPLVPQPTNYPSLSPNCWPQGVLESAWLPSLDYSVSRASTILQSTLALAAALEGRGGIMYLESATAAMHAALSKANIAEGLARECERWV